MTSTDDENFCRICFSEDEPFHDVLENSMQIMLLSISNIEAFEGDGYPSKMCTRCKIILSNAYKFKQVCKRSDTLLKMYPITKKIPPKIEIIQEKLPSDKEEELKVEIKIPEVPEVRSIGIGCEEIIYQESETQTDAIEPVVAIEQMEMIISNDVNYETIPILAPPESFEDQSEPQFSILNTNADTETMLKKPKILANEKIKILNKSSPDKPDKPAKQFKKPSQNKAEKFDIAKAPKILNSQIQILKTEDPIIESIEETPDGGIQIITYDNEEYLEEEEDEDEQMNESHKTKRPQVMDRSEDGVVYTCDVCDRGFPLLQQLEIHKQNHERARNHPCEFCEKSFFSKYDLAKHILTHTKQKDYTCIVCSKSFSRSTLLYRHEKIHTDPSIPRYQCENCDRVYLNKLDYEKHQTTHAKNRPFACNYCDKRFTYKQGLERHEVIHDMQSMPHLCQYCADRFKSPAQLQRHLSSAHAGTRAFPCSKCSKRFMLSHHLYRHMRTSHRSLDETITLQCPDCEESFIQRELFFDHCLDHASDSFICPMCKFEGDSIASINAHIHMHSKSDMYFCDYCSCIFMSHESLNDHLMDKHSDCLCAIGEDEIEFIVEKPNKEKKRESVKTEGPPTKKIKQNSASEIKFFSTPIGASFVEYEEINDSVEVKNEKTRIPKKVIQEEKLTSPSKSVQTVQRVKMTQSEIKRLQKEGKIIMQGGMLVMKQ